MRHSCRKLGKKHCGEWPIGKTESEIKLLIQENRKQQQFLVYTGGSATKDQSERGFTVKQGATTIHEDSAASTSSLTMEVKAVTYALRWIASRGDSQTTHAFILTDSMSLLQKRISGIGLECVNGRHPPSETHVGVLPWACRSEWK